MASNFSSIVLDLQPKYARISLRNPPLNVITLPMMDELAAALTEIDRHPDISTIVISGSAQGFSAGVDVAAHTPDKVESMLTKFHAVIRALISTKKVTIVSIRGSCLGGGAELAMVCDLVYTAETAQWGFPEIKLGCYPPVACVALGTLVGQKKAADLILTGRTLTGAQAAKIGLASRAIPEEQLQTTTEEAMHNITQLSPIALAATKKAIYLWDAMHFDKGLARAEKIYLDELIKTEDAQEGIAAFREKRMPKWEGK
jgi:cyclohexa-1,5-dienecarbonyl-CoA hydratase